MNCKKCTKNNYKSKFFEKMNNNKLEIFTRKLISSFDEMHINLRNYY